MKISKNTLVSLIKESIKEQSQSWFDYARKSGKGRTMSDDELQDIYDKMGKRTLSHYDDGKNEYIPRNKFTRQIFNGMNQHTVNDIARNSQIETPTHKLNGFHGDPYLNWSDVEGLDNDTYMSVNGSTMRKAKADYKSKDMEPKDKEEFYKKEFPGRYKIGKVGKSGGVEFISESQLRSIIRNVLKEGVLNEFDPDEWDEDPSDFIDRPEVSSKVEYYFNPTTLEMCEENENAAYISIYSNDFPHAWCHEDGGDYWTPPSYEEETGECGGDYEVWDFCLPESMSNEDEEKYSEAFCNKWNNTIIEDLEENARFA